MSRKRNHYSKQQRPWRVFVYGSLKQGFGNHHYLRDGVCVGPFRTEPIFSLVSLGSYPAAITNGMTPISGEVYEVTQECYERLLWLEHGYDKVCIRTPYGPAIMFVKTPENGPKNYQLITSGDWTLDHQNKGYRRMNYA